MAKKANKTDRASIEEYGLVKYGTEIGTALEGNKIEEITGKTYGGVLNEAGLKEAGKTYFDKNTQKLYLCKNNNTDISANVNNYIAMDSNSLLDRLENLYTTKEEKTKLSLAQINNVDLNNIIEPGFYTSSGWSNNIINIPTELNHNEGRAFYLLVFSLENGAYCQQILYSFKGLIFFRAKTGANTGFNQWRKINLI